MRLVKYNLICPGCKHEFQRKFGSESLHKGKTSCIKCKASFKRMEFIPDSGLAKIKDIQKRSDILNKLPIPMSIVRGNQVPSSLSETRFKARAIEKGCKPHRPSWPDFFVETEGGVIFVEVKSRNDTVKPDQELTFNLLERFGMTQNIEGMGLCHGENGMGFKLVPNFRIPPSIPLPLNSLNYRDRILKSVNRHRLRAA